MSLEETWLPSCYKTPPFPPCHFSCIGESGWMCIETPQHAPDGLLREFNNIPVSISNWVLVPFGDLSAVKLSILVGKRLLLSYLHKQEPVSLKTELWPGLQHFHVFGKRYSGESKAITDFLAFICFVERADWCLLSVSGCMTLFQSAVGTRTWVTVLCQLKYNWVKPGRTWSDRLSFSVFQLVRERTILPFLPLTKPPSPIIAHFSEHIGQSIQISKSTFCILNLTDRFCLSSVAASSGPVSVIACVKLWFTGCSSTLTLTPTVVGQPHPRRPPAFRFRKVACWVQPKQFCHSSQRTQGKVAVTVRVCCNALKCLWSLTT